MSDSDLPASQPHDAYFKEVFSQPAQAAVFFRQHLPAKLAAGIEWATLTLLPSSFVQQTLQQSYADLLFSVKAGRREVRLFLLFEHQSSPDPLMPLRLLAYQLAILQAHERDHGLPLPPVLAFVLHQGPEKWSVSCQFEDLFELPSGLEETLLPFVPKFRHGLLDLSRCDPAVEEPDGQMRMVLNLMKLAREKQVLKFLAWLAAEVTSGMDDDLLRRSLLYALYADSSLDLAEIAHTLEKNEILREKAMSTAQMLIAKGEAKGLQEGRQEGRQEGVWIGKLQVLEELLGLAVTPREDLSVLSQAELERRFRERQSQFEVQFKRN